MLGCNLESLKKQTSRSERFYLVLLGKGRRMDAFHLMETVVVTVDIPDEGILAGDVGTVVDIYTQLSPAYEVEFTTADGSSRSLVTLAPNQMRHLLPMDVLTIRQLPSPH
jgi:hypothetical protein